MLRFHIIHGKRAEAMHRIVASASGLMIEHPKYPSDDEGLFYKEDLSMSNLSSLHQSLELAELKA